MVGWLLARVANITATADSLTTTKTLPTVSQPASQTDRHTRDRHTGRFGVDSGSNLVFYFWEGREPDNQRQTAPVTIDDDADEEGKRGSLNGWCSWRR